MTYLTRKRTSSNSQEAQSKGEESVISKTKNVVNKRSLKKVATRGVTTRSTTTARKTRGTKDDTLISQNAMQKENQRKTRSKKVSKEDINQNTNKVKLENVTPGNSTSPNKKEKKKKIIKEAKKKVSNSKQMSLKESFLNQSKRKPLTSHQNPKSDTSLAKMKASKRKLPVYECLSPECPKQNGSEIYEFKFDINDSKERLPKKRRKKTTVKQILVNKKKRNVAVKHILSKPKVSSKRETSDKPRENKKVNFVITENKDFVEPLTQDKNSMVLSIEKKDSLETENKNLVESVPEIQCSVNLLDENKSSVEPVLENKNAETDRELKDSDNTMKEQTVDNTVSKPTIVSVEDLSDKRISIMDTLEISNADNFKPFRPTNIFDNRLRVQQKNALNYSLFEKSLSPITKATENPQINSPWRASPLLTFSQVKNVFQSTPQNSKFEIISKKFVRNSENKPHINIARAKSNLQKNNEKGMSEEGRIITNTPKKKNPLVLRKFGTEITNLDHSLQSKSPMEQINERKSGDIENIQSSVQSINTVTPTVSSTVKPINESKKNYVLISPKKTSNREVIQVKAEVHRENVADAQSDELKENLDPQPGPSGLQYRPALGEQRVLRQSNLNNFLDIAEMPQSTAIVTSHGIFDDGQSMPITSRLPKKAAKQPTMELQNAFGFTDDDSNQDASIADSKAEDNKETKAVQTDLELYNQRPVGRLSIGEIKNKLLIQKLKKDVENKENIVTKRKETKKSPTKRENKSQIDIANFSDTFDIMSETGNTSATSVSELPLFVDYEPSYFTKPPQHSYKRKRVVRFSFSENESEEEKILEQEVKRKKTNKLKKAQEERLMEWMQDINRTFNEIDQHELVVE